MHLDMHYLERVVDAVACLDRHFVHLDMHHRVVQNQLQMVEPAASDNWVAIVLDSQALASIVLDRKDKVMNSSLEVVACPSPTTEKVIHFNAIHK